MKKRWNGDIEKTSRINYKIQIIKIKELAVRK